MQWKQFLAGVIAAVMVVPASPAAPSQPFKAKLSSDKQVMNVLDRLTFGARPGDYERVKRVGVKRWIEQQLHPDQIPESALLDAKLMPLESLRMSPIEVAQHYPPPQMIKAIAAGRQPMPEEPVLRASLIRLVARYQNKQGEAETQDEQLEPKRSLGQILKPAQIQLLKNGTLEQKRELLSQLPTGDLDDLVIALPAPLRQRLFNAAPVEVRRKILLLRAPQQVIAYDLLESKLLRAVYSNRQLAEQLDDFWFNHFNVFYDKGSDRFLIPSYERDAIRPNVLGAFRNLLEATAKSPAMLFYLDNFRSVKGKLNENYGRELLELHTLGVNGGYTQHDVIEVARCFTGWGIQQPRKGGGFFYNDKVHDKGEKVVLGHVIAAGGGMDDGEKVLDILAAHESTARFISRKLAQRFVADNPPPALVDRMAKTFLAKKGDIREVMKVMLNSKEFGSEGAYRAKVKTPFEMVASAVRALDANVDDAYGLANQIGQLGQPLYRKQEPTGYSNLNADWVNSAALLGRMNFALKLTQNQLPGVMVDSHRLEGLQVHNLSAQTQATIASAAPDKQPGLLLGSPEFQRK